MGKSFVGCCFNWCFVYIVFGICDKTLDNIGMQDGVMRLLVNVLKCTLNGPVR